MTAPISAESKAADLANLEADVIVVGMGPGGESVGGQLAEAGLVVVGIEAGLVGGECPYWGCIPSKMMIRAANLLEESRRVTTLAGASTTTPAWQPVAARIREQATDDWDDTVAVDRFVGKGGHFIRGRATIVGSGQVEVNGQTWTARTGIVVANKTVTNTISALSGIITLAPNSVGAALMTRMIEDGEMTHLTEEIIKPFRPKNKTKA